MSFSQKSDDGETSHENASSSEWSQARSILEAAKPGFDLTKVLFEKQLPFGLASSRFQTACCTRRSGKTVGELAKLLAVALSKPDSVALYITLSRINAARLAWDILKKLNDEWKLGGVPGEAELRLAMPNGARIYLTGCADMGEVEKFRGLPLSIVVIDESQSFPTLMLKKLIDEVLSSALMDFNGKLVLVGTPGPVPVGYFYECVTSKAWEAFNWSVFDNPWILKKSGRTPRELLDDELKRRGVTEDDPVIRREWFGEWVLDPNSLVFRWDSKRNARPARRQHQHHVVGVDLGFDDADAIAVLGWSDDGPDVDLVHEWVGAKQTVTTLMGQVKGVYERFKPLAVVADTGGLGKKVAEEITARTRIPLEAADKPRKLEHIEWVNDALRTDRLFAPLDSRFAQDCLLVEWDKSNPEKPKISDRFHSDICDAVLYAYVKALGWLHVPAEAPPPKVNTLEWFECQAAQQSQREEQEFQQAVEEARQRREEMQELSDIIQ